LAAFACAVDIPEAELGSSSPITPTSEQCLPPSPTQSEITDSALQKSQYLLKQLSNMDFDSEGECDSENASDIDTLIDRSQESPRSESEQEAKMGMVEVPTQFLKMLFEMWEQLRDIRKSNGMEDAPSSLSDIASFDELCKYKVNERHPFSRDDLLSTVSTILPRSDSDSSLTGNLHDSVMAHSASLSPKDPTLKLASEQPVPMLEKLAPASLTQQQSARNILPLAAVSPQKICTQRALMSPVSCHRGSPVCFLHSSPTRCTPSQSFRQTLRRSHHCKPVTTVSVSQTVTVTTSWSC